MDVGQFRDRDCVCGRAAVLVPVDRAAARGIHEHEVAARKLALASDASETSDTTPPALSPPPKPAAEISMWSLVTQPRQTNLARARLGPTVPQGNFVLLADQTRNGKGMLTVDSGANSGVDHV